MINYYSWGISINIVEPITTEKTRVKYIIYNLKGEEIPSNSSSSIESIELEDQEVVLSVQKGLKSKGYNQGPLIADSKMSGRGEHALHHFHRLVQKTMA